MAVNVPLQTVFANTRAGTVYQTTSAGGIAAVSANTTRTAHWRGGKPHALFEPSRTNLLLRSAEFDNAAWSNSWGGGVTLTANDAVAPDGTTSAEKFQQIDSVGDGVSQALSGLTFDGLYTVSCFIKNVNSTQSSINLYNNSANEIVSVNWSGASVSSVTTSGANISGAGYEQFGNGWVRLYATVQVKATTGFFILNPESSATSAGAGAHFWGAQLEVGAFPTSHIPTSGSAVTRAADNATCSVSTFPIDQNGGSIEIIGRAYYTTGGSGFQRVFQIDDGSDSNNIQLTIGESANILILNVTVAGVGQANETLAYTSGDEFHAVLVFAEDNVFLSLGGSNSTHDTTASFPTGLLTTWRWAQSASGNNGAAVLINRIASHSHEFSTTAANTITG